MHRRRHLQHRLPLHPRPDHLCGDLPYPERLHLPLRPRGAAAIASFVAAALTEIYLCGVCSRQEILSRNGRAQATAAVDGATGLALVLTTESLGGSSCSGGYATPALAAAAAATRLACEGHFCESDDGSAAHVRTPVTAVAACVTAAGSAGYSAVHQTCVDGGGAPTLGLRAACELVSLKRLLDESPRLQFPSECQRF
jgi:hypothetical protein